MTVDNVLMTIFLIFVSVLVDLKRTDFVTSNPIFSFAFNAIKNLHRPSLKPQ